MRVKRRQCEFRCNEYSADIWIISKDLRQDFIKKEEVADQTNVLLHRHDSNGSETPS
jgi:hypothetical protein